MASEDGLELPDDGALLDGRALPGATKSGRPGSWSCFFFGGGVRAGVVGGI